MKNKFILLAISVLISLISLLAYIVFSETTQALAWVSVYDTIAVDYPVVWKQIVWTQELEDKRIADLKAQEKKDKPVKITPKVEKPVEKPNEETKEELDMDKLARAVAIAETGNCTKGYGKTHFNCHGIKSGNTYPCPWTPKGKMCKFKDKEESFIAFKVIWGKWYKIHPNLVSAQRWTGHDNAVRWLYHVNLHYEK